jgi:hypothetical protein
MPASSLRHNECWSRRVQSNARLEHGVGYRNDIQTVISYMKLGIEIGNPDSLCWEHYGSIDLAGYTGPSSAVFGRLPSLPTFVVEFAVEKFELDIHGQAIVQLYAFYSASRNMISLMVDHQHQRIAQAMGTAFSSDGAGMILMFRAPGATMPVNLVCQL